MSIKKNTKAATLAKNDIVTIKTETQTKENTMSKATKAVKVEAVAVVKEPKVKAEKVIKEKVVITLADLKLPKDVQIRECSTCAVITNTNGNKWYLKGKTLQITQPLVEMKDRIEKYSKEDLENGHLGKVTCYTKVTDTNDLQSILAVFASSQGPAKKEPKVKPAKTKKIVESPVAVTDAPSA